jgi:pyrroloquinoline quinone biosynthesis protein A
VVKLHSNKKEFRIQIKKKGDYIMWTTPSATEMRFGFEVTMYVMNK